MYVRKLIQITVLLCATFFSCVNATASENTYRLSTDDVISVTVFNEPDLNLKETKINDDGTISVPLLGQVNIQGKTVLEVETLLNELFEKDYLVKPQVSVSIDEFRPFYINGEVDKPGSYAFRTGMTVEIAITLAGGFTERASRKEIFLASEGNKNERRKVSLDDSVKPGDIITIEESFF
ncbi:MAG: polysaccharide export protein [Glaciecola sp.]|jgi:polysaccharide biosynthesis/export protein VpsN|nr:polysaccharide export protein [Glaciecola sp.]MDG1815523.1 polysaccharide export protein [Glaciecola sp.]MDG2099763.1 polysaccharide export protein [Glaciecola sp.]